MFCWPPSRRCLANARSARPLAGSEIGTRGIKTALHRNQQPNNRRKSNCRKHQRAACKPNRKRCYQSNGQYSVTALTDATGSITERYAYDAYGKLTVLDGSGTVLSGSAYGNRYTYTGREWDDDLGLFHYRARMYDPVAGRFCSKDPIGYGDGFSLYASYMSLDLVDPSGNEIRIPDRDRDYILGLLNELCPDGDFSMSAGGTVTSGLPGCPPPPDPRLGCMYNGVPSGPMPGTSTPESCGCVCAAIGADCTFNIQRARVGMIGRIRGRRPRPRAGGSCREDGEVNIYASGPRGPVIGNPIYPDITPGPQLPIDIPEPIDTPDFLVLGHELCGHGVPGLKHPDDDGPIPPYSPDDPVTKIENCIRKEHSTPQCDYGQRTGGW